MNYNLILDDILKWAAGYTGPKFHSIFCDPPYHLTTITKRFGKPGSAPAKSGVYGRSSAGFMGQAWDGGDLAFNPETWAALTEHLYPGGFVMAFAGTRGYHRMACAMEDSGLVIHPALGWVTLSGFPKSTRIDVQVDRAAGAKREIVGNYGRSFRPHADQGNEGWQRPSHDIDGEITAPATPLAQAWAGHRYGLQALKPAFEFTAVAQKPYEGRPIDNITQTGAGALNIDGSRIPGPAWKWGTQTDIRGGGYGSNRPAEGDVYAEDIESNPAGRWPANLILDEEGSRLLDEQSGESPSNYRANPAKKTAPKFGRGIYQDYEGGDEIPGDRGYDDSGGASRMFFQSHWSYEILEQLENADPLRYEPKVSTSEREAGLDELPERLRHRVNPGGLENEPRFAPVKLKNHHPTLKPISLCKYLTTLLLPPDAYAPRRILVPFAGTGSEMAGAILAGWDEVTGIEANPDYRQIAEARLAWWSQWPGWGQTDVEKILGAVSGKKEEEAAAVQLALM